MNELAALSAICFALICLFAGRLGIVAHIQRETWLSFAGGVATGYVFVHLLPEIDYHRQQIDEAGHPALSRLLYAVLLLGTCIYYGLESYLGHSRRFNTRSGFAVHMAGFALYFGLIGYFLQHRGDDGAVQELFYVAVLGLHILALDTTFRLQHPKLYDSVGRWVMAASVIIGWAIGAAIEVPPVVSGMAFTLLAGGMILNILKQELPASKEGRFMPFLIGAGLCASLLAIA